VLRIVRPSMSVPEEALDLRDRTRQDVVSAFSVDVEDYFHVEGFRHVVDPADWDSMEQRVEPNTRRLLDLLDESGTRATFFVLGWVAERRPGLVADIHAAGHELAIHGYDHRPITAMTPAELRADIRRAKGIVEDAVGAPVLGYRAPTYSVVRDTMWALDVMIEEGLGYDSSIFPIVHDRYGIPDAARYPWTETRKVGELVEFPVSTVRLLGRNLPFVGGGYLRLLPMPWVRWGMRRVTGVERRPAMLYVHPWEIDPGQPVLEVPRLARVRHYRGLERVEDRLRGLLREFRFDTVRTVLGL
jgi:polysaccharide deacetylase family protein (PEP-CTERM system associated)